MPGRRDRQTAMEMIQAERQRVRRVERETYSSECIDHWLGIAEAALEEAGREIDGLREDLRVRIGQVAHYKGMLAARDGREVILTFDRIGTEGVPTHFEDGTRLKCTDSDREWVLIDSKWAEVAP